MTHNSARLGIIGLAFITGSNYFVMKTCVSAINPLAVVFWRFIFATIILLPFFRGSKRITTKDLYKDSFIMGITLGLALILLAYAISSGSSGETAFWISSDAAFVPIILYITSGTVPNRKTITGSIIALVGLGLLSITQGFSFKEGSIIGIASAIVFAIWLILLSRYAKKHDSFSLGILQIIFATVITTLVASSLSSLSAPRDYFTLGGLIYLGSVGTGIRFIFQSHLQKFVNATDTALLYLVEPVIAASLGYLLLNEVLTSQQLIGCVLVLIGVAYSQISNELIREP